jgi:hypothetical protein
MRCMLFDAEMILMNVVQDDTMPVAGFEHRTFMCSSCHDVERRLVFVRAAAMPVPATQSTPREQSDSRPVPQHDDSAVGGQYAIASQEERAAAVQNECAATPGMLRRMVARLRGR